MICVKSYSIVKTLGVLLIALAFILVSSVLYAAQTPDHLCFDKNFVDDQRYKTELLYVFRSGFEPDVILRAVAIPSLTNEFLVGLKRHGDEFKTFIIRPSVSVANLRMIRAYESGSMSRMDSSGKIISYKEDEYYKQLRKITPNDYHDIGVTIAERPISVKTANMLFQRWKALFSNEKTDPDQNLVIDGIRYYLSVTNNNSEVRCEFAQMPSRDRRIVNLTDLVELIEKYVNSNITDQELYVVIESKTY